MKTISQVVAGEQVDLYVLIQASEEKRTQNGQGKPYLDFVFKDSTGSIDGKMWDTSFEMIGGLNGEFSPGIAVKIRGTVTEWNGKKQIKIERIRLLREGDPVTKEDLIEKAPLSTEKMFSFMVDVVHSFQNEDLKKISLAVLDKYKEKLTYYPASLVVHHNIKAGLLYHTYCILQIAMKLATLYPMNQELLYTGCIIHDIGKFEELDSNEDGVAVDYTKEGKLLGHMITGIKTIHDLSKELDISPDVTVLLEHMIASHHYKPEYGAVRPPMFYEAELLHHIDMIDCRTYIYQNVLNQTESNTFSDRVYYLDNRQIFKPNL